MVATWPTAASLTSVWIFCVCCCSRYVSLWWLPGPLRRLSPQFEFSLSAADLGIYLCGGYLAHCSGWSLLPEPHRGDDHQAPPQAVEEAPLVLRVLLREINQAENVQIWQQMALCPWKRMKVRLGKRRPNNWSTEKWWECWYFGTFWQFGIWLVKKND